MPRPIYEIAADVRRTWPKVNYAAKPYLDAMLDLDSIDDKYFMDDARDIVLRFIGNAGAWRGDDARRIKAELRAMLAAR
jgi:hypothetical protein